MRLETVFDVHAEPLVEKSFSNDLYRIHHDSFSDRQNDLEIPAFNTAIKNERMLIDVSHNGTTIDMMTKYSDF